MGWSEAGGGGRDGVRQVEGRRDGVRQVEGRRDGVRQVEGEGGME